MLTTGFEHMHHFSLIKSGAGPVDSIYLNSLGGTRLNNAAELLSLGAKVAFPL